MGNGEWWLDTASHIHDFFYHHTIEKDGMPPYHHLFQEVTHTYMETMTEMGAGAPSVGLLMHRNRQLYEYFLKLSTLTFVTNSVGLPHEPPKTLFKKDEDTGIVFLYPSSVHFNSLLHSYNLHPSFYVIV